ncbi:hypothetical protein N0V83_008944 [Neocucurbitaria cava]|uniref:Uncharacterized protein n=1 Tax=Neocucurbitaria cava TaxID=798079 RepID=A0A9W8Y214_9PLEO|nr:hypothetical protein N0V83_008944 [Neocucurbitaria cava]
MPDFGDVLDPAETESGEADFDGDADEEEAEMSQSEADAYGHIAQAETRQQVRFDTQSGYIPNPV